MCTYIHIPNYNLLSLYSLTCLYVLRADHLVLDNTNRHAKVKGENSTRPQPYTKIYRRLKNAESGRNSPLGKSTPIGPMHLYDEEKSSDYLKCIPSYVSLTSSILSTFYLISISHLLSFEERTAKRQPSISQEERLQINLILLVP